MSIDSKLENSVRWTREEREKMVAAYYDDPTTTMTPEQRETMVAVRRHLEVEEREAQRRQEQDRAIRRRAEHWAQKCRSQSERNRERNREHARETEQNIRLGRLESRVTGIQTKLWTILAISVSLWASIIILGLGMLR